MELQEPTAKSQINVKSGQWWGSIFYGGSRCCAILSPYMTELKAYESKPEILMSFPVLLDSERLTYPTIGKVGQSLWDIQLERTLVLDGYLGVEENGDMTWPNLEGRHLPPKCTFFVHDAIGMAAFKYGGGKAIFSKRRKRVGSAVRQADSERVRIAPYKRIDSKRTLNQLIKEARADGAQLMLRKDVPYKSGKSSTFIIKE